MDKILGEIRRERLNQIRKQQLINDIINFGGLRAQIERYVNLGDKNKAAEKVNEAFNLLDKIKQQIKGL